MTNQEVIELYKQNLQILQKSKRTINDYSKYVESLLAFTNKLFSDIKKPDIQKYINYKLNNGRSAAGVNPAIAAFNSFFAYCNDIEEYHNSIYIQPLPDKGARKRKEQRDMLPSEEVNEFILKLEEYFTSHLSFNNSRRWILLYLMLVAMLRKFEITNILESDIIQLESKEYRIPIHGKGGFDAHVTLPETFREPLNTWLDYKRQSKLDCPNLVCTDENKPMYPTAYNNTVNWMTKHAEVELKLSPHRLRHAGANYLKYQGAEPEALRQALRHKRITTTLNEYYHPEENIELQKKTANLWGKVM